MKGGVIHFGNGGLRCEYFKLEVILRSRSKEMRRVEQSRWKAIIQVALRAAGPEIY